MPSSTACTSKIYATLLFYRLATQLKIKLFGGEFEGGASGGKNSDRV